MARLKNNGKMGLIGYLKSLAETNSGQSSKAFAVLASTLISFLMGLTLCFAIGYDVYTDGVIDSDMQDMGILMLCMGGFVGGSSVSKIFGDQAEGKSERMRMKRKRKPTEHFEPNENMEFEDDMPIPDEDEINEED